MLSDFLFNSKLSKLSRALLIYLFQFSTNTSKIIRKYVECIITVSEDEIVNAIKELICVKHKI